MIAMSSGYSATVWVGTLFVAEHCVFKVASLNCVHGGWVSRCLDELCLCGGKISLGYTVNDLVQSSIKYIRSSSEHLSLGRCVELTTQRPGPLPVLLEKTYLGSVSHCYYALSEFLIRGFQITRRLLIPFRFHRSPQNDDARYCTKQHAIHRFHQHKYDHGIHPCLDPLVFNLKDSGRCFHQCGCFLLRFRPRQLRYKRLSYVLTRPRESKCWKLRILGLQLIQAFIFEARFSKYPYSTLQLSSKTEWLHQSHLARVQSTPCK